MTVDPVAQPNEYQRLLLSLLGDDDPAESQRATSQMLHELASTAGPALAVPSEPGEWSALGCIAHIVDAEIVASGRYRWILAHDTPELLPYDQDLWIDRLHDGEQDAAELLRLFDPLRQANLALWARTPTDDRARFGIHRERGPESYELTFKLIAGHDRFHIDQARRALAALESTARPG